MARVGENMALAWWLFVRGTESTRVEVEEPLTLVVRGPGEHREEHQLPSETALAEFAIALEQELFLAGWTLAGFEAERRAIGDRRRQARDTRERRAS
jgi:hypothetical protein